MLHIRRHRHSQRSGNVVQGNYIGTNAAGTAPLPNFGYAVVLMAGASNTTVGGTVAAARNVLSGNDQAGVGIFSGATGNVVRGNYIGTNAAGTAAIGNQFGGVWLGARATS